MQKKTSKKSSKNEVKSDGIKVTTSEVKNEIPRAEYPRPEAARKSDSWQNLNGEWLFDFDEANIGLCEEWYQLKKCQQFSRRIIVPFPYQSKMSGINIQKTIDVVWYARSFQLKRDQVKGRVLLHFGAVDYETWVYLNGIDIGHHIGGLTPFVIDITKFLTADPTETQWIALRVYDNHLDPQQPRGKQYLEDRMRGCSYERISGIWQTVWLEFVNDTYLDRENYYIRADPYSGKITASFDVQGNVNKNFAIECQIFDENGIKSYSEPGFQMILNKGNTLFEFPEIAMKVDPKAITLWSPKTPVLYSAKFRLIDADSDSEQELDQIIVLFGFRSIEIQGNKILLNKKPIYLKFALYQGYWVDSLWTPPSDEAIKRDLELTLEMGWNGLRLHQKVEEPRLHYWADKMGVLVWGEIANCFLASDAAKNKFIQEWMARVNRDRNHPSIIAWIPINESWGARPLDKVENQSLLKTLYHLTKTLDSSRPVNSNDGWEMVNGGSDICSFHNYQQPEVLNEFIPEKVPLDKTLASHIKGNNMYAPGNWYEGQPVVLSEWGGWGFNFDNPNAKPDHYTCWGYQGKLYKAWDEIMKLYGDTIDLLVKRKDWISGHVYTEFCDQYQEMNGMLTYDRRPKGDLKILKKINDRL